MAYDWPGNVRELENVIERALILHGKGLLTFDALVARSSSGLAKPVSTETNPPETLDAVVTRHIKKVLRRTGGKIHGVGGAAEMLGVKPNTLRARMDKLGIPFRKRRNG
jgi:DNA-binding NtrC family response regulator